MSIKVNGKTIAGTGGAVKKYSAFAVYAKDNIVLNITSSGVDLYKSLEDNNVGNDLSNQNYWQYLPLQGNGFQLFDVVEKDHILTYAETKGM